MPRGAPACVNAWLTAPCLSALRSRCVYVAVQVLQDLTEHLKTLYHKCGVKDEGVMLLITDNHIQDERNLLLLNDLLSSGDIYNVFTTEERENLVTSVVGKVKAVGLPSDKASCWKFLISQIRKNLHVALCFSPENDRFRVRATRFPALITCTGIDWFHAWPLDALRSVAKKSLMQVKDLGSPAVRDAVERFMPAAYESTNRVDVNAAPAATVTSSIYSRAVACVSVLLACRRQHSCGSGEVCGTPEHLHNAQQLPAASVAVQGAAGQAP